MKFIKADPYFRFYLNSDQIKIVSPDHDQALKEFSEGRPGSVFCQIGITAITGKMLCKGCFLPHSYAKRIRAIIDEYITELEN